MEEIESKDSSQEEIIMLGSASTEDSTAVAEKEVILQEVIEETSECVETSEVETVEPNDEQKEYKTDDGLSVISEGLQEVSNKVEQMNQLFMQKIAHTTHEEKIVDQMHAELQKYKQDM